MKKLVIFLTTSMILSSCYAGILNGDFEYYYIDVNGFKPPAGWYCENYAKVVSNFKPHPNYYGNWDNWKINTELGFLPFSGKSFLELSTQNPYLDDTYNPEPNYAKAQQVINVEPNDIISGQYFFGTCDYIPYGDDCYIKLIPHSEIIDQNTIILVYKSVEMVGDFSSMEGWEGFRYIFSKFQEGEYDLVLLVRDTRDSIWDSYMLVDSLKICSNIHNEQDLNFDCIINIEDFVVLATDWTRQGPSRSDINDDNIVDYKDLKLLLKDLNYNASKILNFVDYANMIANNPLNQRSILYIISKDWLK